MLIQRLILILMLVALSPHMAVAAKRVALVIGNSSYKHAAVLDNPANDAKLISAALRQHGFEVIQGADLTQAQMLATIREFSRALRGAEVGAFFYAGHGIQVSNRNYLVPIDAKLADSFGIDFELVRLERIHRLMEESAKVNLIFLDACRNNPLSRNLARSMGTRSAAVGQGLARMESGVGSLISFSTQPGNVALDGRGARNSPYSSALAKHIAAGKGDISEILIKVRRDVMVATAQQQVPWEHSALTRQFHFIAPDIANKGQVSAASFAQQAELVFWNSVKDTRDPAALQTYLDQYPRGVFAPLARVMMRQRGGQIAPQARAQSAPSKEAAVSDAAALQSAGRTDQKIAMTAVGTRASQQDASAGTDKGRQSVALKAPLPTSGDATSGDDEVSSSVPKKAEPRPTDADTWKARVEKIQARLRDLGCYRGEIDGQWGPISHSALEKALDEDGTPEAGDMDQLDEAGARTILASLGNKARLNCTQSDEARASKTTPTGRRRSRARNKHETRKAKRVEYQKRAPQSVPKRRAKRCRTTLNPDSFTDEKAPKVIRVCE